MEDPFLTPVDHVDAQPRIVAPERRSQMTSDRPTHDAPPMPPMDTTHRPPMEAADETPREEAPPPKPASKTDIAASVILQAATALQNGNPASSWPPTVLHSVKQATQYLTSVTAGPSELHQAALRAKPGVVAAMQQRAPPKPILKQSSAVAFQSPHTTDATKPNFASRKVTLPMWALVLAAVLVLGAIIGVYFAGRGSRRAKPTEGTRAPAAAVRAPSQLRGALPPSVAGMYRGP